MEALKASLQRRLGGGSFARRREVPPSVSSEIWPRRKSPSFRRESRLALGRRRRVSVCLHEEKASPVPMGSCHERGEPKRRSLALRRCRFSFSRSPLALHTKARLGEESGLPPALLELAARSTDAGGRRAERRVLCAEKTREKKRPGWRGGGDGAACPVCYEASGGLWKRSPEVCRCEI